ncbi:MAG: DUF5723 family protein [Bacteroidia bacterium]|nr:DUF5723 family protein [Bacteroidia bacterium]MDW8347995.1 DUF5723 family protein [Bacteroidia bacterium]
MKRVLSLFFLSITAFSQAQYNLSTTYCEHNDLNASRYEPSELHLGNKHVQIGSNFYFWIANNAIDYATIKKFRQGEPITEQEIDNFVNNLQERNQIGAGQDFQIGGVAFQLGGFALSLSAVDRFAMEMNYSRNLMKLAWKGNKQFAGQRTQLGPLSFNAHYTREYAVGMAFNIVGNMEKGLRVGARGKYIQGMGSIYMPKSDLYLTTAADGRSIEAEFDYKLQTSGIRNFNGMNFNGMGYGVDAGISAYLSKHFEINASLLDFGAVTYNKDVKTYQKQGKYLYEGAVISNFFGDPRYNLDSISSLFKPEETSGGSYTMNLGTRVFLQGELKWGGNMDEELEEGEEYQGHSIFFTYIQGLNNMPGTTTKPYFSVAYNYDLRRMFNFGVSASMGGYNRYAAGAFLAFNLMHILKIGIGSDNLMPLVQPKLGTGADVCVNVSVAF